MKVRILNFLLILACVSGFYSCEDDNEETKIATSVANVTFKNPKDLEEVVIKKIVITMKEKNTGNVIIDSISSNSLSIKLTVPQGFYDITADGSITYKSGIGTTNGKVKGIGENVSISRDSVDITVELFLYGVQAGLIFEEIFVSGTETPENKSYRGDSYFKIYNNSNEVIYADGYVIAESKFMTITKQDYRPNIMNEAFAALAVYMIPGNGTDVPVEPGKSIILCDQAINHKSLNPNSFDLSAADFEWYDETSQSLDTDNPAVPNLTRIYAETKTIWIPNNQGNKSYVLAKLRVSPEKYIADYKYEYEYDTSTRVMTGTAYKVPNAWVVDAVNLSYLSGFEWLVMAPTLDLGWTYCSDASGDKTRFGKSVKRKVLSATEGGRNILQDTNNSTEDFIPRAAASLKK